MAIDPGSTKVDADRIVSRYHVTIPQVRLAASGFVAAAAQNQNPTTLLFRNGQLVDRRLGAQTAPALRAWLVPSGSGRPKP